MAISGAMFVESVHRYPVKSMQGEQPGEITFEGGHVVGDRQWAVVDPGTGFTLSAKRHGALLEASASSLAGGSVRITLPDGTDVEAGDTECDKYLSDWLGHEVELRRPGSANLPFELLADSLEESSEVVSIAVPESHFADLAEAHLLTRASLRAASVLHPLGDWDYRRFRPTVVIAGDGEGFVEDGWVGSSVALGGDVRLEVFMPTIRCSMPARPQPGIPRDNQVPRVLKDNHNFCLGVYAAASRTGAVRAGDEVTVIAPG